jgi:hypothetical protein
MDIENENASSSALDQSQVIGLLRGAFAEGPSTHSHKQTLLRRIGIATADDLLNATKHPRKELKKSYTQSMRQAYILFIIELANTMRDPAWVAVTEDPSWPEYSAHLKKELSKKQNGWLGTPDDISAALVIDHDSQTIYTCLDAAVAYEMDLFKTKGSRGIPGCKECLTPWSNSAEKDPKFFARLNRIINSYGLGATTPLNADADAFGETSNASRKRRRKSKDTSSSQPQPEPGSSPVPVDAASDSEDADSDTVETWSREEARENLNESERVSKASVKANTLSAAYAKSFLRNPDISKKQLAFTTTNTGTFRVH